MRPTESSQAIATIKMQDIGNGDLFEDGDGHLCLATPNIEHPPGVENSNERRMVVRLEDGETFWMQLWVPVVPVSVETFEICRGNQ